jgi:hypothetical protein
MRSRVQSLRRWTLVTLLGVVMLSCGKDKSPTSPSSSDVSVTAISPSSGTTLGGTPVTITGSHFTSAATVTIGGAAATNVTFVSDSSLTAVTPQHASGAADVVVSVAGTTGTLHGGFTFSAPDKKTNEPPTIAGITAKGSGRNEPGGYSDIDETLNVVATVTDPETAVGDLKFQWSADEGTFNGAGPTVTWTSPHDVPSPHNVTLTLTVIETYQTTDDNGLPATKENKTTGTAIVSLHDSRKEVRDMAEQFMDDFSHSEVPKSTVMRNFLDSCRTPTGEDADVDKNRELWHIDSYKQDGSTSVDLRFGIRCEKDVGAFDACAYVPWEWHSTCKRTGQKSNVSGKDQVSAIYQGNRWWLCTSYWLGSHADGPDDDTCRGKPGATSSTVMGMRTR